MTHSISKARLNLKMAVLLAVSTCFVAADLIPNLESAFQDKIRQAKSQYQPEYDLYSRDAKQYSDDILSLKSPFASLLSTDANETNTNETTANGT